MSINIWIDKVWYKYTHIHIYIYSTHISCTNNEILCNYKNEILLFVAIWMGLEGIRLSEISQRRHTLWYYLYVESKKYNKLVNIMKGSRLVENKLVVTSGKWGVEGNEQVGEWEIQTIGCKTGSRMHCTTWGI